MEAEIDDGDDDYDDISFTLSGANKDGNEVVNIYFRYRRQ